MTARPLNIIKWTLIFGVWTIVAFFYTTQVLIQNPYLAVPLVWWRVLIWELFFCYIWFAFTPLILQLSRDFPLERGQRLKNLSIYILASLVFSVHHIFIFTFGVLILPRFVESGSVFKFQFFAIYRNFFAEYFHFCLISFWGVITVNYLVKYYRAYQERELKASQLEATLAQSQLQILKTQLQPHFLFNTLNTISELVHEDSEIADKMISRLSTLLRMSLDTHKAQEISLRQELNFLQQYLDIEQARFEKRLRVKMTIPPDVLDAQVPNMILQPLVENAVRYAVAPRASGGQIKIKAKRKNSNLQISVEDDGENMPPDELVNFKEGVGLSNTRGRLEALYREAHSLELKKAASGGLIINIEIPFRTRENKTG